MNAEYFANFYNKRDSKYFTLKKYMKLILAFSLFKFRFFWLYLIISGQIYGYSNNDNNIRCRQSVVKHNPLRNRSTIGSLTVLLRSRQPSIVPFATMPAAGFLNLAATLPTF